VTDCARLGRVARVARVAVVGRVAVVAGSGRSLVCWADELSG
jgi:hypothetical protein